MSDINISIVQPGSTIINTSIDDGLVIDYQGNKTLIIENDSSEALIIGAGISFPTHSITHISGGSDELSHNFLNGLQGGNNNQYYHISSGQYFNLTTGSVVRPSETGIFYTNDNLSGFITGVDLSPYATINYISGISGDLQTQVTNLNSKTGGYVLKTETGGFITNSQTGAFYPISNPSGYITGAVVQPSETGNFITINQTGSFYPTNNPSGFITGVDLSTYVTGDVVRPSETGVFVTQSQTGVFYPRSNPSGFITGVNLSSYATQSYVTGISGGLQTQITNLNNQTGSYYPRTNPSGYITGIDLSFSGNYYTKDESESRYVNTTGTETILGDKTFHDRVYINNLYVTGLETIVNTTNTNVASNYIMLNLTGGAVDGGLFFVTGSGLTGINDSGAIIGFDHSDKFKFGISTRASDLSALSTIVSFEEVTGISGNLQTQISTLNNQTGGYVLKVESGQFYPISNPSGYITGVDLSSYVLNTETGNFITTNQTGLFYSNSNPSGFITGVDLSSYATTVYVTGISGGLQSQITDLSNATGSYILNSQTGQFYTANNPSGFITGIDNLIYTTGDQTISGIKNFATRPTINGTGVLLSGEGGGSTWLQNGANIYYNNGNVGIGTSTPTVSLEVTGMAIIQDDAILNGDENTMPNQTLNGGSGSVITKAIGDVRYLERNPVVDNTVSHTIEQFEDFDKYTDTASVGTLLVGTAFGTPTLGVSPLFGNSIAPSGGFTGNDRYTWNGAILVRGPTTSNQAIQFGLNRCLNADSFLSNELTVRFMLLSYGMSTGYFRIGPIPWGGTGGGDQALAGGLVYNPVLFGNNNLYLAVRSNTGTSPFTFTTNIANVVYVDTGFNFASYLNKWINITYKYEVISSVSYIRVIIKQDTITLYDSGNINLSQAPYNTWSNVGNLHTVGASRKLGISFGVFTYSVRQELYLDYIYEKVVKTPSWTPPSNWNQLRF